MRYPFTQQLSHPTKVALTSLIGLLWAATLYKIFGLTGAVFGYIVLIFLTTFSSNLISTFIQIPISFFALEFFFIDPIYSFSVGDFESWLMLISFATSALAIFYGKSITLRRNENRLLAKNRLLGYLIPFTTLTFVYWISRVFGRPNIEQIIFHFEYSSKLFEELDRRLILSFFNNVILTSLVASILMTLFEIKLYRADSKTSSTNYLTSLFSKSAPIIILTFAVVVASLNFGVKNYFDYKRTSDYIKENYVNPDTLKITKPSKPRNLILIYVESLDKNYSNTSIFGENLLQELDDIKGIEFKRYIQTPGTGWTIAGIVSTQCAIPLKPIALANINMQGNIAKKFLPNVTCLGDTLSKAGYTNVFLGGASSTFSGKGKFLEQHGYTKIMGKEEWLNTGRFKASDMNGWGLYDDDLMSEAKSELDRLELSSKPFNLTLLTVDTHFPNGFLSKTCKSSGGSSFTDIVKCTSHQVADIIGYTSSKGYLKNTNIVILGDHL